MCRHFNALTAGIIIGACNTVVCMHIIIATALYQLHVASYLTLIRVESHVFIFDVICQIMPLDFLQQIAERCAVDGRKHSFVSQRRQKLQRFATASALSQVLQLLHVMFAQLFRHCKEHVLEWLVSAVEWFPGHRLSRTKMETRT